VAVDRESPSYEIRDKFRKGGGVTTVYDPFILSKSDESSLEKTIQGKSAILLLTGHSEFKRIDCIDLKSLGIEVVVDGRNFLDMDKIVSAGIVYKGIGRE
jgi:UDP-N-acetyl-D-mannosaminuronate dehydrogenase